MKHSYYYWLVAIGLSLCGMVSASSAVPPPTKNAADVLSATAEPRVDTVEIFHSGSNYIKYLLHHDTKTATVLPRPYRQYVMTIPETVTYDGDVYTVTALADRCFASCDRMSGVHLPNSIQSFGNKCFAYCYQLDNFDMPAGLVSIGDSCFYENGFIDKMVLPDGVTSLGRGCFSHMSLKSVTLSRNLADLYDDIFEGCSLLQDVYCNAEKAPSVTRTGKDVGIDFYLVNIHVPENSEASYEADEWWKGFFVYEQTVSGDIKYLLRRDLKTAQVFSYNSGISSVTIPATVPFEGEDYSVTSLRAKCFKNCGSLTSVTLPAGVTTLGESCFSGCGSLKSITLPNGITSLGNECFYGCKGLTGITLPESLTSLGYGCFSGCSSLWKVTVPASVTLLDDNCFYGCTNLTYITLPDGLVSLGSKCFSSSRLRSVVLPDGLTTLGSGCFSNCSNLWDVTLSRNLATMVDNTFDGCYYLTDVYCRAEKAPHVSKSCRSYSIGFYDAKLHVPEGSEASYQSDDWWNGFYGNVSSPFRSGWTYTFDQENMTARLVSVRSCQSQEAVPNSVTYRGEDYVVKSLGNYCFNGFKVLTSITLPDGLTSMGVSCFYGCSGLKSITLPDGLTSLDKSCFEGCSGLKSITLPDGLMSLGKSCFEGCSGLTSIKLPDGIMSLGGSCFADCSGLTSIVIPDQVPEIESFTFPRSTGLTSITLPMNLQRLGSLTFETLDKLTDVYCYAGQVPRVNWEDYQYYPRPSSHPQTTLHVLDGLVEEYKNSNFWHIFGNIVGKSSGISSVGTDAVDIAVNGRHLSVSGLAAGDVVVVTDMAGRTVYKGIRHEIDLCTAGIYIVAVKGRTMKVIAK